MIQGIHTGNRRDLLRRTAFVAALVCAAGCQPAAHVQTAESATAHFEQYRAVAFEVSPRAPGSYATWSESPQALAEVRETATEILADRGYLVTSAEQADVIVRIEEGRRKQRTAVETLEPAPSNAPGATEFQGQITTKEEEEVHGSFVIEAVDVRTQQLVWRGAADAQVTPGTIDHRRIRAAVQSLLRSFPRRGAAEGR